MKYHSFGTKDYTKATIRLKKIHERSLKKTYTGLSLLEKQIVKNHESWNISSQALHHFWKNIAVYKTTNGVKIADQEKTDWSFFYQTEKKLERLRKQLQQLQKNNALSDDDIKGVINKFNLLNRGRFYGGSF